MLLADFHVRVKCALLLCEILGFLGGGYESNSLLGCEAVSFGRCFTNFSNESAKFIGRKFLISFVYFTKLQGVLSQKIEILSCYKVHFKDTKHM